MVIADLYFVCAFRVAERADGGGRELPGVSGGGKQKGKQNTHPPSIALFHRRPSMREKTCALEWKLSGQQGIAILLDVLIFLTATSLSIKTPTPDRYIP